MEEISQVWGSEVIKSFVGDEEDLEMYTLFNGKPVKLTEDGGDVFSGGGSSEQSGSRVLNILQLLENRGGEAIQDAVTVVKSGGDEGVD